MAAHPQGALDIERASVLFIDDDPNVTMSLRVLLEPEFETYSASTVAEGLDAYQELHPSAVILDLRLPDRSGLEALREIRAIDANARVVVLTAYATEPNVEASLRLGAMDCLHKPFDALKLKDRIIEIAGGSGTGKYAPATERHDRVPAAQKPSADLLASASSTFLHDVNNPLSAIVTLSEYLSERVKDAELDREEIIDTMHIINENALYISSLVDQWRAFTEPAAMQVQPCTIQSVFELASRLALGKAVDEHVNLEVAPVPREWKVRAGRFALARVIVNLLNNAIDASRDTGGKVHLSAAQEDGMIQIWVRDDGHGIAIDPIERIFEPGVTTRSEGMGLGLFICKTVVESLGGTITVRRREQGGTAFRISLRSI